MASTKRPGPEPTQPREPTPREKAARSGDIDALWDELVTKKWTMVDQEEIFGHLLRAIEVRSREDPEAFAGDMFARMTGLIGYLTLRSHFYLGHRVGQHGRATRDWGPADFPKDVVESLLPRTLAFQGHLSELMQAQASVARQWELVHGKRAENGRGVGGDGKANGTRRPHKAPASANGHTKPPEAPDAKPRKASGKDRANGKSNGHAEPVILDVGPINRIGRYLNGHGSGSNGVGHDD